MAASCRSHHIVIHVDGCKECIFRVPKVLRRQKTEAYTPDVVSIGPFHHPGKRGKRKGHFQLMKRVKKRYRNEILSGMNIKTLEELTAKVTELSDQMNEGGFEERARGFYAEPKSLKHISSDDFKEMMILDGCFLIQLFRKCNDPNLRDFGDPVFIKDKKDKKDMKHKEEGIMDIKFEEGGFWRNGVLYIPQLNVGILSLTLFRNLIAIEQCYHGYSNEITSYAILMDNLISSHEDMELLRKAKVIGNWLSDEDGCNFFNNLHKDVPHNDFYYKDLCKKVNERYKMRRYTWLALLKIENFSNPWKILAFGFGIVALFLSSWASINNIRRHM